MGTGTAIALSNISQSIIEQDMLARKVADTNVAVVVTPTEPAWGSA